MADDCRGGLRTLAEVLLVPAGGDVWLDSAGGLEITKATSFSDEQFARAVVPSIPQLALD